jgi:hypothetical protein
MLNLYDCASPETADTIGDSITDDTTDCVVPQHILFLPSTAEAPVGRNKVALDIAGVLYPIGSSEV